MAQKSDNRVHLFRLQIIIIDGGLLVLRNIIDQTLTAQGVTLSACLKNEKATITRLKSRGLITQVQYDILFPTGGQVPTTSEMDFTLILCLMRCLKCFGLNKKFDWNSKPISNDFTVEADICRLKAYRNKISHISTTTGIQPNDFVVWWNDIEQILIRRSSPCLNIHQTIADFKGCPLDQEEEERLQKEVKRFKDYEAVVDRLDEKIKQVQTHVYEGIKEITEVKGKFTEIEKKMEELEKRQYAEKGNECVSSKQTVVEKYQNRKRDVQTYCRKTYKGGGNMRISNKTYNIAINQMSIGNIVVNSTSDKTDKREQALPTPEKTGLFESFYSESSATEEECHQFASTVGMNAESPRGNFIDTREFSPITESVFESSVRVEASRSVCMICFPGGRATGFRVGARYIMTANHVVNLILISKGYGQMGNNPNCLSTFQSEDVFALFEYKKDEPISEHQKFSFTAAVPFRDNETDCAILELEEKCNGTELPRSFKYFSLPRLNQRFTFIGHSLGKLMEFNHVDKIIDIGSVQTKSDIIQVKQKSLEHSGKDYDMPPHNILTNPKRFLFSLQVHERGVWITGCGYLA